MNKLMSIYEHASSPGSYGGIESLYREARKNTVLKAFLNVRKESARKPTKVQTDARVVFTNRAFKSTLKKQNIHFYVTFSENKAAVVEHFNRTLKHSPFKPKHLENENDPTWSL